MIESYCNVSNVFRAFHVSFSLSLQLSCLKTNFLSSKVWVQIQKKKCVSNTYTKWSSTWYYIHHLMKK